ncbi:MAG: chloride channel protein [Gemmatimonadales bacterium]
MGPDPDRTLSLRTPILKSSSIGYVARIDLLTAARAVPREVTRLSDRLIRFLMRIGIDEHALVLGIAGGVGALCGLAIVAFYRMIDATTRLFANLSRDVHLPEAVVIGVALALGIATVRLLVRYGTHDSGGENIPDVIHAVARRGGVLPPWKVVVKTVAAAFTIASGGSVGVEGPVAVLGAGMGSATGQWFRFGPNRLRLLVGCGAAAGISGAFGAPIAGVFFAMEEILGGFRSAMLASVVVASAAAAAVTRNLLGQDQVIRIPTEYAVKNDHELAIYALVGILCGIVGVIYSRSVWKMNDLMDRFPPWARLLIAAGSVGLLTSFFAPALWGRGHQSLDLSLVGSYSAGVLIALAGAKIAATSLTLAGGGVGGVFTPAIVIGGTFGAGLGVGLAHLFPDAGIQPVPYGLVGMAAVLASATHAPLTGMFIVLEITNDYALIVPLMLAASLAYVVARRLQRDSIYTEWLSRRGESVAHGQDEAVLVRLKVADAYRRDAVALRADSTVADTALLLRKRGQLEFPVINDARHVVGMFTWAEVVDALEHLDQKGDRLIEELASPAIETVSPDDTLLTALQRLGARDAQLLPVVGEDGRFEGVVGRQEVFAAYERELA